MRKSGIILVVVFLAVYFLTLSISNDSYLTSNYDQTAQLCRHVDLNNMKYDHERATLAYDSLSKLLSDKSDIRELLDKSITLKEYAFGMMPIFLPLLIMFIIMILMMLCCSFICCCCKRNTRVIPYSNSSIYGCSIFASLMLICILGAAIAGFIYSGSYKTSSEYVQCAVFDSFNDLLTGDPSSNWIGINGLSQDLTDINNNLTEYQTQITNFNQPQIDVESIPESINILYSTLENSTVQNPIYQGTPGEIEPTLIQILGPPTNQTTISGTLTEQYNTITYPIYQNLLLFNSSVGNIGSNFAYYTAVLTSAIPYINQFQNSLDEINGNTTDYIVKFSDVNQKLQLGLSITFGFMIGIAALGVISISFLLVAKVSFFKFGVWASWCIIGWFTVFGFLLTTVLFTASIVALNSCSILDESINNQTVYQQYAEQYLGQTFYNDTEICLYGNGSIPNVFGFEAILEIIDEMSVSFDELQFYQQELMSQEQISLTWENIVQGQIYDPACTQNVNLTGQIITIPPSSSQVIIAINSTNQWSDYSYPNESQFFQGGCKVLQDLVMFNYTNNCNQTQVPQNDPTLDIGQQVCVAIYDDIFLSTRLNSVDFSTCTGDVQTQYSNQYDSLVSYWSSLNPVLTSLQNQLANVTTQNDIIYGQFNQSYNNIINLSTPLESILNLVSNNQTGLYANLNCTFLRKSVDNLQTSFCDSFLVEVYSITVILICICSLGFFTTIFLYFSISRLTSFAEDDLEHEKLPLDTYNRATDSSVMEMNQYL